MQSRQWIPFYLYLMLREGGFFLGGGGFGTCIPVVISLKKIKSKETKTKQKQKQTETKIKQNKIKQNQKKNHAVDLTINGFA